MLSSGIIDLAVGLAVLHDVAIHGTVVEPDLGGFDPARRVLTFTTANNRFAISLETKGTTPHREQT